MSAKLTRADISLVEEWNDYAERHGTSTDEIIKATRRVIAHVRAQEEALAAAEQREKRLREAAVALNKKLQIVEASDEMEQFRFLPWADERVDLEAALAEGESR